MEQIQPYMFNLTCRCWKQLGCIRNLVRGWGGGDKYTHNMPHTIQTRGACETRPDHVIPNNVHISVATPHQMHTHLIALRAAATAARLQQAHLAVGRMGRTGHRRWGARSLRLAVERDVQLDEFAILCRTKRCWFFKINS